jgi:hypothetical protein
MAPKLGQIAAQTRGIGIESQYLGFCISSDHGLATFSALAVILIGHPSRLTSRHGCNAH